MLESEIVVKFWSKVNKTENCWVWTGTLFSNGYGLFIYKRKNKLAHRISYFLNKGKIPKDRVLDHLCRNTRCVNPEHLEAVTIKENNLRGISPSALNSKKSFCSRNHPLSGDNLGIDSRGDRYCKKCHYYRTCVWRAKNPKRTNELNRKYKQQKRES